VNPFYFPPVDLFSGRSPEHSLAFGRAVLNFFLLLIFALYERKNEQRIIMKYHAAAGNRPIE
jgi:hypothetical protein